MNKQNNTDGIRPRTVNRNLNQPSQRAINDFNFKAAPAPQDASENRGFIGVEPKNKNIVGLNRAEVQPDEPVQVQPKKTKRLFSFRKKKEQGEKRFKRTRKVVKRTALAGTVLVVMYGGLVFLKSWTSLSNIIDRAGSGSPVLGSMVEPSELSGEGDGRVNIMLLGIGGEGHQAGTLADTIMVLSIDPIAKEAGLLSIPRDLYVTMPHGYGSNKINAAHAWGELYPGDIVKSGVQLMDLTLESILGIPIHYYVKVDFTGFQEAVDAVGGIDITLDERVYDPIFDREYGSHALDIGPGLVHLDGLEALLLGRARGSTGGFGLSRSDFDRGDHQRKMLVALKEKALSLGTFSNPQKLLSLLSALENHLSTNLQIGDMLRLYELAEEIPQEQIISYGLSNGGDNYLVSQATSAGSSLVPRTGNFEEIKSFVRSIFVDGFIKSEDAEVDVLNGTETAGIATTEAVGLEEFGYRIGAIANAPKTTSLVTYVYDITGETPFTLRYLEQRYNTDAKTLVELPEGITTDADIVIIIGSDRIPETDEET